MEQFENRSFLRSVGGLRRNSSAPQQPVRNDRQRDVGNQLDGQER
jgi:hypothetical protein